MEWVRLMANEHRRRPVVAIVVVVLIVAAGVGAYLWWDSRQAATDAALRATGTIEATEYQVASAIAGRVATVTVGEGEPVKAGVTLVTLDDSALALQVQQAEAGVNAAQAQVESAKDSGTDAEVRAAEARLAQAQAAVELAKVQLGYATVSAPHDGLVVAVATNEGQNASPGKTMLTLSDPEDLFVRVFVPETRIGEVKIGQPVRIKTDSSPDQFAGKVAFIASEAEFTPNNVETEEQRAKLVYAVRVRVSDTSGTLKAGMPVDVTFE